MADDDVFTMTYSPQSLQTIRNIKGIGSLLKGGIAEAINSVADRIVATAQANTETAFDNPTGNLKNSIHKNQISDTEVDIIVDVPYARRMEFGFNGTDSIGRKYSEPAKPYLIPAIESETPSNLGLVSNSIMSSLRSLFS